MEVIDRVALIENLIALEHYNIVALVNSLIEKQPTVSLTPCDLCTYNPPSSCDGKPCTMCPACAKEDAE